jgi:hypothetical protein
MVLHFKKLISGNIYDNEVCFILDNNFNIKKIGYPYIPLTKCGEYETEKRINEIMQVIDNGLLIDGNEFIINNKICYLRMSEIEWNIKIAVQSVDNFIPEVEMEKKSIYDGECITFDSQDRISLVIIGNKIELFKNIIEFSKNKDDYVKVQLLHIVNFILEKEDKIKRMIEEVEQSYKSYKEFELSMKLLLILKEYEYILVIMKQSQIIKFDVEHKSDIFDEIVRKNCIFINTYFSEVNSKLMWNILKSLILCNELYLVKYIKDVCKGDMTFKSLFDSGIMEKYNYEVYKETKDFILNDEMRKKKWMEESYVRKQYYELEIKHDTLGVKIYKLSDIIDWCSCIVKHID